MAKGKGKQAYGSRKASAADLAGYDDGGSESSKSSTVFAAYKVDDTEEAIIEDVYEHSLDQLLEKRGATRVKALEDLISFMKADVRGDESHKNCMTMIHCCISSLRKGGTKERELAAVAMGLHIISLPEAAESLFLEMQPELERAACEGPADVRSAAIEMLAMVCYIAAEDEILTRAVMDRLQELWSKGEAGPRAAAMRGWTLLFTSLGRVMRSCEVESILQEMADQIGDKSVDVRSSAGGVVAAVCASYKFLQPPGSEGAEEEDDVDEGSEASSADISNLDGLVDRMRDLATHNRHDALRTSKRDKAALRTTFRGVLDAVEAGAVKPEKIKLKHNDVLIVDTLAGKVALDAIKRVLGSGLQAHLQSNALLHCIFDFSPSCEAPARLSYLEKRHFRSPSSALSRDKTAERKMDRAFKSSRQVHISED